MAFVKRKIEVTISLAEVLDASGAVSRVPRFDESGQNTVTLSGRRVSATINKAGGLSDCTLNMRIFGLSFSMMNQLSTLGMQINLVPKNGIVVTAGDEGGGLATVFVGYILSALADFEGAPEVGMNILAHTGLPEAVIPAPVSSFKGSVEAATVMSGFATAMGLKFENNGVTTRLSNPYYDGSLKAQAQAAVREAGIEWNGGDNGVLAIWPKNGSRGGTVPLVSPATGLIGYPAYNGYGLMLTTIFNPSIGFGNKIKVESSLPPANGIWSVYSLDHVLEAETPNGQWFSKIGAYNPSFPTPALPPGARS